MPDLHTLPARSAGRRVPEITAAEAERRAGQVRAAAARAGASFPFAASQMTHWIGNTGDRRDIALSDFDFTDPTCGLPAVLRDHTWKQFAVGSRYDSDLGGGGVEARLGLPESNANSLSRPGSRVTMRVVDSHRARPAGRHGTEYRASPQMEQDLSIAMGGYTIACEMTVESGERRGRTQSVRIVSWKVQVMDRYDWIAGAPALVPVPPGTSIDTIPDEAGERFTAFGYTFLRTNDTWFQQIEQAGRAHWFDVYSEVFEAPANLRRTFVATDGRVNIGEQSVEQLVDDLMEAF